MEKLGPSKTKLKVKPKVKPKVWYFVFKYWVRKFRHRLLKGPSRNIVIQFVNLFEH